MSNCGYAVFFEYNNKIFRLPVNPEEIEVSSTMAIQKYEILKLGQISIPTHMELNEYSFECEFPVKMGDFIPHYVEIPKEYHGSDFYLSLFNKWRQKLVPVKFMASRVSNDNLVGGNINTLVLIESMTVTEKAGEEGDKYIAFKLVEYQEFNKYTIPTIINPKSPKKKKSISTNISNPKSSGYYVVKTGDSLWSIAKKHYGDGTKSNVIYNANKNKIKNPALIKAGWKLKIPSKDEFSKYSAALPIMKISTSTRNKVVTQAKNNLAKKMKKYVGSQGVAGISLFFDNITKGGPSHSSGGRSLDDNISPGGRSHSSGGRDF